ncbi:MAG: rod shape-determining protein MreC [Candidatus Levybacteria bacterium]|nr:rod shape-determining protein MreC [Candidatus Levybacteria bacterium]
MKKRENFFFTFFIFLLISIFILGIAKSGLIGSALGFAENLLEPVGETVSGLTNAVFGINENEKLKKLESENRNLQKKIVELRSLDRENNALRDQFKTQYPKSANLLPAKIVGAQNFIPNVTVPDVFLLDKGVKDGVKTEQGVIFENNLVGKVIKTSVNMSLVDVLTNKNFSFTAKTSKTQAQGVIKGNGNNEMIFDNVLLSEKLEDSDIILTKGDLNINSLGLPPNLIVGKIVSVDKKPSSLFQTAKIQSLLDFTKLETVFVVVQN